MLELEDFVVLSLVVFSMTVLIKDTEGPFHIFDKIRDKLVIAPDGHARKFFTELFACPWCIGTWISLFTSALYWLIVRCPVWVAVAYWIASIGVTGFLYTILYSFVDNGE